MLGSKTRVLVSTDATNLALEWVLDSPNRIESLDPRRVVKPRMDT